jgi:hypothetical protein
MSDNKIQNEQELWDVLDGKAAPEAKPEPKPAKTEPKFAKADAPKGKVDSFFLTCMAGVAAVSEAATLLVSSLVGGEAPKPTPAPVETNPGVSAETTPAVEGDNELVAALELENADLRAQVELQKDQIKKLQAELLDLQAASGETPVLPTDPDADAELVNAQLEAYDIFNQIKEAYADFDREKLEQLTPEMDKRLTYLSSDALYEYYMILEYVEMPSNG